MRSGSDLVCARLGIAVVGLAGLIALSGCGPSKQELADILRPAVFSSCEKRTLSVSGIAVDGLGVEMLGLGSFSQAKLDELRAIHQWFTTYLNTTRYMRHETGGPTNMIYNDAGTLRHAAYTLSQAGPVGTVRAQHQRRSPTIKAVPAGGVPRSGLSAT